MRRLAPSVLGLLLVASMAGCSSGASEPVSSGATAQSGDDALAFGLTRCEPDAELPSAPADWYRDTPRYVGNEQPVEEVRAWAQGRPGFQEIWIDRNHNGWIGVAFTGDAAERQVELGEAFPDVGVVAVQVDWRLAELRELQREVAQAMQDADIPAGVGVSFAQGAVAVDLGLLTESNLAALAPFADRALCVNGGSPADAVTGPQVESGPGWRLLAIDGPARRDRDPDATAVVPPPTPGGLALGTRIEVATNPAQFATAWDLALRSADGGLQPGAPLPDVDFETEVVVLGHQLESGSCRELLTGVTVENGRVRVDLQVSDEQVACTSDGNPLTWAVAVERSVLPPAPFTIQGPASLTIEADLRSPGAVVDGAATVARPAGQPDLPGFEQDPRGPGVITDPTPVPIDSIFPYVAETGFSSVLDVPVSCLAAMGPINGFVWEPAPDAPLAPPDEWLAAVDPSEPDERIPLELLLQADPSGDPTLDATANGVTVRYVITDRPAAC